MPLNMNCKTVIQMNANSPYTRFLPAIAPLAAGILALGTLTTHAGLLITITQVGPNVVGSVSGSANTAGLTYLSPMGFQAGGVSANEGYLTIAGRVTFPSSLVCDEYDGISGPTSFGTAGWKIVSSGSGDIAGVIGFGTILRLPSRPRPVETMSALSRSSSSPLPALELRAGHDRSQPSDLP